MTRASAEDSVHPAPERLSALLDGDLDAIDAAALRTHLDGCPRCRETLDEIESLVRAARDLTPRAPRRDLWPEVRSRLAPRAGQARTPRLLAAAALVVVLLAAGLLIGRSLEAPSRPAPTSPPTLGANGPTTAATEGLPLAAGAAEIEAALRETRRALDRAPDDPFLRDHLRRLEAQSERLRRAARRVIHGSA